MHPLLDHRRHGHPAARARQVLYASRGEMIDTIAMYALAGDPPSGARRCDWTG